MSLLELDKFAENIIKREDSIYVSRSSSTISFPEEGNEICLQLESDSFWFNHRNNILIEAIKKLCPKRVFFDIGGGNGFVTKRLQEEGIKGVLVEPGLNGCLNGKRRGIENIICSTFEDAQFRESSIEAVGLFDVVEHIEDDLDFLKKLFKALKVGGFIFITVPAYMFLWSNEDKYGGHFKRYNLNNLRTLLTKAGFEVEYSTYIFSILPIPIFIFRTIPSWLGLHKKTIEIAKHQKEHRKKGGLLNNMMRKIWDWELKKS